MDTIGQCHIYYFANLLPPLIHPTRLYKPSYSANKPPGEPYPRIYNLSGLAELQAGSSVVAFPGPDTV
jgi:hypothetical protein